jgi:hypothetical protein
MVKQYHAVTSFASGYGSDRLICQLPDGKTEMIVLQEVVHLLGSINVISQCQIRYKDIKVNLANHYGQDLHHCNSKLVATAAQVNRLYVLHHDLD